MEFDHVWRWRTIADPFSPVGGRVEHPLSARVGHLCRVVARGRMNSVLVEFQDGTRVVASRYAVRRSS